MHARPSAAAPASTAAPSLQRLARLVRGLVAAGALVLASVPFWLWTSPVHLSAAARALLGEGAARLTVDDRALWLHAAASLPGLALGFFLLWQLWQLFGEYGRGRVFSAGAVQRLRRLALGVMALGIVAPLSRTGSVLALTWGNPVGERQLLVSLSSDDYLHLVLGAVLLAIVQVMAEAVRLAQENAEFV